MTAPVAIDVSDNNGLNIDWHAVRGSGVRIAIAKCCEGEGGTHPGFVANWRGIDAANFERRGTYHFARAEHAPQANAAAAMRAISEAGGLKGSDFVALDVEAPSRDVAWPLGPGAPTINWTLACLAELERLTGRRPWLYCSQGFLLGMLRSDPRLNGYPLWIANINEVGDPGAPGPHALWQFTWKAAIAGINGAVDGSTIGPAYASTLTDPTDPGDDMPWTIVAHPTGTGYWCVDNAGHVYAYGAAKYHGGLGHMPGGAAFNGKVIGLAPTVDGSGYWLMTDAGLRDARGNRMLASTPSAVAAPRAMVV
jgi:GH25 family lysozyme M1 (1,4-beta-N-acetylmuramidase)